MKFTCEKYILQNACTIASRATAAKSPIPSLEGILIQAGIDLRVTGYDLKKGIYTNISADVAEPGSIVLAARLFGEMLRKMPDGIVSVECDRNENVFVKCGKSEFNFMGMNSDEYPELPSIDGQNSIVLPQKTLKSMINQTIFAVADNDARPIYTGVLFEMNGSELTMVAIDGYRLAKRVENIEGCTANCSFVVPGSALSDIERICEDSDNSIEISVGVKHIVFTVGETVVITRKLEGEFMNYRKSIPENFKYTIEVERVEFMRTIDRVALIVDEKNRNAVRLTFNDGFIYAMCITPIGKAEDTCTSEGSGDGIEIGFNDRYMTDALKAAGKEKVKLCINTPSSPCVIKSCDGDESFTYMILPVRLRAGA